MAHKTPQDALGTIHGLGGVRIMTYLWCTKVGLGTSTDRFTRILGNVRGSQSVQNLQGSKYPEDLRKNAILTTSTFVLRKRLKFQNMLFGPVQNGLPSSSFHKNIFHLQLAPDFRSKSSEDVLRFI